MIRYQGLWSGPIDRFEDGGGWAYGYINVYEEDRFLGFAVLIPKVRGDDFAAFLAWLENFESSEPLEFSELAEAFEEDYFELDFFDEW